MDHSTKRWMWDMTAWTAGSLAGLVMIAHQAMAGGDLRAPASKRYQAECGSCHIAYPPQLLPAEAWRRMLTQLDRHFGTDATVDPAAAAELGTYLEQNAASGRRAGGAAGNLRITESSWFVREHRKVPAAAWKSAAVKSAANCAACHTTAEQGDFRERNIRIPR